jgi:flagellar basal body-associated protein FliL
MEIIIIVLIILMPVMLFLGAFLSFMFFRMGYKLETGREIKLEIPKLDKLTVNATDYVAKSNEVLGQWFDDRKIGG